MSNASGPNRHASPRPSRKSPNDSSQRAQSTPGSASRGPANDRTASPVADPGHEQARPPVVVAEKLRDLRQARGLSLAELALKAGLSGEQLTQLESGTREPDIKAIWSLANALGLPFRALLTESPSEPPAPSPRKPASAEDDALRSSEAYEITLASEGSERALPRAPGAQENVQVTSGLVEVWVEKTRYRLGAGESAAFAADVERRYHNLSGQPATLHIVISEPSV